MIKEFFKEHDHLRFSLQHLDAFDGGWKISIYNTTYDFGVDTIYTHFIEDKEIDELNVDFETAIMTPIINWWKTTLPYNEEKEKKRRDIMINLTNEKEKKRTNELENILTEASIEEIDNAIREIDWLCEYDITDRSSDIAIVALKYVRKLQEMEG